MKVELHGLCNHRRKSLWVTVFKFHMWHLMLKNLLWDKTYTVNWKIFILKYYFRVTNFQVEKFTDAPYLMYCVLY